MEELLTPKELASLLKIRTSTISIWVRQNRIPHYIISAGRGLKQERRTVRFSKREIMSWLHARQQNPKKSR